MSVPTLQNLYTAKTADEVLAVILEVAADLDLPTTAWQAQGVDREILFIIATAISRFTDGSFTAAAGGLLDYASGDWLTLLAYELYNVTRTPATFGTCTERLTNTSAFSYTPSAGDVRFYNVETGKTYTSTTGGTLGPGDVTPTTLDVTIVADEAGSASNATVGQITGFVTPMLGVTGTNLEVLVGEEEQDDVSLRTLCKQSLAKASPNGPADAYNYFAKIATRTDGTNIGVTRTNLVQGDGTVIVYVADDSGPIDAADLADVDASIQLNAVPTGITAETLNATGVTVNIATTIYLTPGSTLTQSELSALVVAQLTDYFAAAPIGGYVVGGGYIFFDAIIGQIFRASSQIIQATMTTPSDDVALDANEVGVLGTVTVTLGHP